MKDQRDGPLSETADTVVQKRGQAGRRLPGSSVSPSWLRLEGSALGTLGAAGELEAVFKTRAEALGMRVHGTSRAKLRRVLDELVGEHGPAVVEPALITTFPELEGLGDSTPDDPGLVAAACGLTAVVYAIAETGSLVIASGTTRWRQFSSVPPVHVAVVRRHQLVPDLLDVLLAYGGGKLPPGFVVLTGPGRVVDSGAPAWTHGPKTLECVIVD